MVVIEPCGTGRKPRRSNSSLCGYVTEMSVTQVAEEMIVAESGYIDVVLPIIVVVANGAAHPVHLALQPSLFGDIGESSVVIVVVERRIGCAVAVARPIHRVHEEDVLPTVIVIVNETHSAAHRLRKVLLSECSAIPLELNPSFGRDIGEMDGTRRTLRSL